MIGDGIRAVYRSAVQMSVWMGEWDLCCKGWLIREEKCCMNTIHLLCPFSPLSMQPFLTGPSALFLSQLPPCSFHVHSSVTLVNLNSSPSKSTLPFQSTLRIRAEEYLNSLCSSEATGCCRQVLCVAQCMSWREPINRPWMSISQLQPLHLIFIGFLMLKWRFGLQKLKCLWILSRCILA